MAVFAKPDWRNVAVYGVPAVARASGFWGQFTLFCFSVQRRAACRATIERQRPGRERGRRNLRRHTVVRRDHAVGEPVAGEAAGCFGAGAGRQRRAASLPNRRRANSHRPRKSELQRLARQPDRCRMRLSHVTANSNPVPCEAGTPTAASMPRRPEASVSCRRTCRPAHELMPPGPATVSQLASAL